MAYAHLERNRQTCIRAGILATPIPKIWPDVFCLAAAGEQVWEVVVHGERRLEPERTQEASLKSSNAGANLHGSCPRVLRSPAESIVVLRRLLTAVAHTSEWKYFLAGRPAYPR